MLLSNQFETIVWTQFFKHFHWIHFIYRFREEERRNSSSFGTVFKNNRQNRRNAVSHCISIVFRRLSIKIYTGSVYIRRLTNSIGMVSTKEYRPMCVYSCVTKTLSAVCVLFFSASTCNRERYCLSVGLNPWLLAFKSSTLQKAFKS